MLIKQVQKFLKDSDAATSVEYAVMLMLIFAVCYIAIDFLGGESGSLWGSNSQQIEAAMTR